MKTNKLDLNYEIRIWYQPETSSWGCNVLKSYSREINGWYFMVGENDSFPNGTMPATRFLLCYYFPPIANERKYPLAGFDRIYVRYFDEDEFYMCHYGSEGNENEPDHNFWELCRGDVKDQRKVIIRDLIGDLAEGEKYQTMLLDYLEDTILPGVIAWLKNI